MAQGRRRSRWAVPLALAVVAGCAVAGCGSSGTSYATQAQQQQFLNEVHENAPDIGSYRNDTEVVRLGHAVCDDLKSGASYGTIADRLGTTNGSSTLPTEDLGAVITSAAQIFCPQYAGAVS